jgi:hypothetical protein
MRFAVVPRVCIALCALLAGSAQVGASRFALATVQDPRGKALVDVGVDDFVVQEGTATREILDVRVADYPLVILLDNSAAARADFDALRSAVARFVERLGPRPIAIVTFGGAPKTIATFEDDRAVVAERLDGAQPVDEAGQPLAAAAIAGEMIRKTGALFSAIVVASASAEEARGADADRFLAPVIDSRAVVHVVFNSPAGPVAGQRDESGAHLRGIASQTHGQFTAIYATASYQPALDRLVMRLTTELLIEYIVPVGSKPTDVKIGVRVPGARVRGLGVAPR